MSSHGVAELIYRWGVDHHCYPPPVPRSSAPGPAAGALAGPFDARASVRKRSVTSNPALARPPSLGAPVVSRRCSS